MPLKPWLLAGVTAAILTALAIFYWLGLTSLAGVVHDDVIYLVTGKSLAESGAYRIVSQPGEPFQIAYPPLYPALLALVWKVLPTFPANLWAFKLLNILAALAGVLLTYRLVTHTYGAPRAQGWMVAGLLAVSSFFFSFMDLTMSEMLFSTVLVGTLIGLERLPDRPDAGRAWLRIVVAIGALVTLVLLVRTIAITLAGAVVLWLLLRRQWRLAIASGGAIVAWQLPWQGWIWWVKAHAPASWDYMGWINGASDGLSPLSLLSNMPGNTWALVSASVPLAVAPLLQHEVIARPLQALGLAGLLRGLGLLVTIVVFAGLVRSARERLRLFHVFLAAYVALLLIFPWDPSRYIVAVTPLLLFAFVRGAWWLADTTPRHAPRWRRAVAWSLALSLVGLSAGAGTARIVSFAKRPAHHDALVPASVRLQQADEQALVTWSRGHMPPEGVWLHHRDPLMFLLTGHKAVTYGDGPHPAPASRALFRKHPTYLVVYPAPQEHFTAHRQLLETHPGKLSLVFRPPGGSFEVYRVSSDWP